MSFKSDTLSRERAIALAKKAIEGACREPEPDGGPPVISDLPTWEIEQMIVAAVTKILREAV